MSENDGGGMLDDNSSMEMGVVNLPKRHTVHIGHLDIGSGSLVSLENASHYVTVESSSQDNITLENVMVTSSRSQVNGNIGSLQHNVASTTSDNYGTLEYVSSPVVSLHEDHHNKYSGGLVPVNNVEFVEINETTMKGSSAPLELYFDVPVSPMPTTSATTTHLPQTTTSYHPRHEHQTPKTQLLARAYSDFIQPQEQQQQLINAQQVHASSQSQSGEQSDSMLPEVLDTNFVQMEQAVISHPLNDYRKGLKYESQKRFIQINLQQQKQLQNFHSNSIEIEVDSHNHKIIEQSTLHHDSMHHQQESILTQHENHHNHLKQHAYIQSTQQLPPKYHLQKQYNQQSRQNEAVLKEEVISQGIVSQYSDHNRNIQEPPMLITSISSFSDVHLSKSHSGILQKNEPITHNMPLVSRSGRPIRRRPEYVEYVNHSVKEDLAVSHNYRNRSTFPSVKIEMSSNNIFEDEEECLDGFDEEDNTIDNSNDEDHDPSEVYSSDGKKFLPHKKRIPKKLKNAKKHIKCYKCSECCEQFINQNQFNQHKLTHTSVSKLKLFNCEICNKGFESQLKFFEHLKSHYEPFKKHKCEVCDGEFANANLLQEHSLVHTKEHFQCNICNKTFRKESMLEVHIKVAHLEEENTFIAMENPYTCSVCPKTFQSQLTLDTHVQADHSENLPEFNCEDCYVVFKSKPKLIAHRKVEHKEEVAHQGRGSPKKKIKIGNKLVKDGYSCTECPRTFTHKNSLIYHVRGHTGERPHQCEQCGKAFYAASALKVHLRLHSGEKPYKCDTCGKFFRQWGDLKYHTSSVHSDTRQFQCEFCGKDFKRKYCLVVHRRIHTGEKKYKCEFCQKSFRASSYLQNHKRIHTGERPYPCPDCGKPFRVRSDMKRHRHTHMRDNTGTVITTTGSMVISSSNSLSISHVPNTAGSRQVRQINHPHNQVQILQGHVSHVTSGQLGQLILTDGVPTMIGEQNQPIRIMVSGIAPNQSVSTHSSQPPPAHKHSQVTLSPDSQNSNSNSNTPSTNSMTPEVIMDESNSQPINLNILPRIITSSSSTGNHTTVVSANDEYEFIAANRGGTIEMREEGDVCVWSGVHVFTV